MSDVFISYARSTEPQARQIADALRALGYGVWRDDELPAHRSYAEVIDERLNTAKAVVVIWSADATKSEWVQSEADRARSSRKLVQMRVDAAALPMPFDRIQCADLTGWTGDLEASGWRKVVASITDLVGAARQLPAHAPAAAATTLSKRASQGNLPRQTSSLWAVQAEIDELLAADAGASPGDLDRRRWCRQDAPCARSCAPDRERVS